MGFMGAGKTTIGKKIAKILGYQFIDLDRNIEKKFGMKIPDIFNNYGEEFFRNVESECLIETSTTKNAVISLGGGTPIREKNLNIIKRNISIYIKLPPKGLYNRLINSKNSRPLLQNLNSEELLQYITEKLKERESIYQSATIIIDGIRPNLNTLIIALESLKKGKKQPK